MSDFDEPRRRRPDDNDDEDRPPRPRYLDRRPGLQGKTVSVIGIIALVIGVISFGLSLVPCLNLFTWPLALIGGLLALIGILISAIGQREGLSVPLIGMVVNVLALAVPVAMYVGFCGFGMQGARQAAVAAQQQMQVEAELKERQDKERREQESASVATVVGLTAGPQGLWVGLAATGEVLDTIELPEGVTLSVNLNKFVREFELDSEGAWLTYQNRNLRIEGTIASSGKDENDNPFVVLQGPAPGMQRIECHFDDKVPPPNKLRLGQRVTVEGACEKDLGKPVALTGCKIVK